MTSDLKTYFFLLMLCAPLLAFSQPAEKQYMRHGNSQFRSKNYSEAEVSYRKSLELDSTNARARYNLGNSLLSQRKPKDAMVEYEKAIEYEKNPFYKAAIYHNMGVILQSQKQFAQAIECYKESLRNYPEDDRTRYNLALCQYQLKNQPQQDQQQDQQQNQDQDDNKKEQNDKQQQQKQEEDQKSEQQQKNQMSKENADQMLQAAMMEENKTQQKVRQALQQQRQRNVDKNW